MPASLPACPACDSTHIVKNGKIHNGKQNYKCRNCGRQFVQHPQNKTIDATTKTLIDKLLLEKISFTTKCFPASGIKVSARRVAKRVTLSASTAPCANACRA